MLLTTDKAGEYLSLSRRTIREMIKSGRLPAAKIGKQYLIDEDDISEFINNNRFKLN